MQGEKFDVARVEESLESAFMATTAERLSGTMWLGSGLSRMLLERQRDHVQSVQAFLMALKVCLDTQCSRSQLLTGYSMRIWLISLQTL